MCRLIGCVKNQSRQNISNRLIRHAACAIVMPSERIMDTSALIRLHLFGSFRLERDEQPVDLPTRKVASLLAYLALHPEPHAREKIATLFWGDSSDEHARRSLRTALAALRKELGNDLLLTDRETVQLNPQQSLW